MSDISLHMFSASVAYFFILLPVFSKKQIFSIMIKSNLWFFFPLTICAASLLSQDHKMFSHKFCRKFCRALTLRLLVNFKLIFVIRARFFFLCIHMCSCPSSEWSVFSPVNCFGFFVKMSWPSMNESISGFSLF